MESRSCYDWMWIWLHNYSKWKILSIYIWIGNSVIQPAHSHFSHHIHPSLLCFPHSHGCYRAPGHQEGEVQLCNVPTSAAPHFAAGWFQPEERWCKQDEHSFGHAGRVQRLVSLQQCLWCLSDTARLSGAVEAHREVERACTQVLAIYRGIIYLKIITNYLLFAAIVE